VNVRPGQIIGEYRLVSFIGAGGMGEVYRAEHVRLGRAAVVKILKNLDAGGSAWKRFFNEARIQAELNHPNIAVLYGYDDSGVTPCIIMEYVDGLTIGEILQRDGKLPPEAALRTFAKIVSTVQYIHERGIIHRDIKPNNIKITSRGEVKLLDFGISKASFSQDLTADGKCIGTDHYLAPEQLAGQPASVASDIWALGALFYEMVTGQKAFEAGTWGELYKAISTATYTPPTAFAADLSPRLERIIATCLKKSPGQRYASAADLSRALQACLTDADPVPPRPWPHPWRRPLRVPWGRLAGPGGGRRRAAPGPWRVRPLLGRRQAAAAHPRCCGACPCPRPGSAGGGAGGRPADRAHRCRGQSGHGVPWPGQEPAGRAA